ncbi:hypothetical protein [Mycolicibacterium sp. A43C]
MTDDNIDYRRKYGMDEPPQLNNKVVDRVLANERLYDDLFTRDSGELFDPVRSPQMYGRAQDALRRLHAGMALLPDRDGFGHVVFGEDDTPPPQVRFDHHDDLRDTFAPLDPDDPAVYVWFVGTSLVQVIRGPKPVGAFDLATSGPDTSRRGVDYYADMLRLMMELREMSTVWPRECNVQVSRGCDGPTQLLPYRAGAFLAVFEACAHCMAYAKAAADTGYELSVMEAHARAGLPFP